jgi:hypothetical protein
MSYLEQLRESIEARIVELNNEIAALNAAKGALRSQSETSITATTPTNPRPSRRRRTTPTRDNGSSAVTAAGAGGGGAATATGAGNGAATPTSAGDGPATPTSADTGAATVTSTGNGAAPAPASTKTPVTAAPRRPRGRSRAKPARTEVLLAGKLEVMLRESGEGLSAVTIAKRAGAGYAQVLALLRDLEQTGQVRRSGTRRTSLWRFVTDEERIAERTAELERLSRASVR